METLIKTAAFIKSNGLELKAASLQEKDKMVCYVMWSNITTSIDPNNRKVRSKAQLLAESCSIINEFRTEALIMFTNRYKDLELMEGVTAVDGWKEIMSLPCVDVETMLTILKESLVVVEAAESWNKGKLNEQTTLVLTALKYIIITGVNQLNIVENLPLLVEGVKMVFYERKRAAR